MTTPRKLPEPKSTVRKAAPKRAAKPQAAKALPKTAPAAAEQAADKPAVPTEISLPDITARLLAIAALGEASGAGPMLSLARAALMDAARLNGLAGEGRASSAGVEDLLERLDAESDGTGRP